MLTKICSKCKTEKPITEYGKKENQLQFACKSCANIISKEWYAKRKHDPDRKKIFFNRSKKRERYLQSLVNSIKAKLGCAICDEKEPCCLDFHHKSGNKDRNVSAWVFKKSIKNVISEIQKCVCVCSNCHRKIHAGKIPCLNIEISLDEIKTMISSFELDNPWIVKYERSKKPKVLKNECTICYKKTNNPKYCSSDCKTIGQRKVLRPSIEELEHYMKTMSMVAIGKMYGVSDNAIRKWLKKK